MRIPFASILEAARLPLSLDAVYGSNPGDPYGAFHIKRNDAILRIIANTACKDSHGWEHVSVSLQLRTPTWDEMCYVKDLFWMEDEAVVQFHPPRANYVNHHPFTLHLWKPTRRR